ncbi:hypothetical protein L211DRAFT_843559 [Terfezia boudieri ATCC MYA-4762]|uniref:J domain-containing protein n=1 Tax=Terfezia boudieri ATCC MYA-4762 TaxID=1051890 RepID=A0A3N4L6I9_9PEZI|nr:hypothetical protein L211DRAFT_843559 [Terfezia boudieri ATCC MYA-4762]
MRSFDISNDRLGLLYGLSSLDAEESLASLPPQVLTSRNPRRPPPGQPDNQQVGPGLQTKMDGNIEGEDAEAEVKKSSRGKFRFKQSSSRTRRTDETGFRHRRHRHRERGVSEEGESRPGDYENGGEDRSEKRRKHHAYEDNHRHHRHHRHRTSTRKEKVDYEAKGYSKPRRQPLDEPSTYDDTYLPNSQSFKYADPDIAFRQSLFDAMADDEGAAFWEGVYGQRVDVYPRPEIEGPTGKLEEMDDDEYASYVRAKMYEKTHEYIFEERLKREKARVEAKERKKRESEEWEAAEKERLRREQARSQKKSRDKLKKVWEDYQAAWSQITVDRKGDEVLTASLIPWPVASQQLKDVDSTTVEEFYLSAPVDKASDGLYNLLKTERVKWHPDKMQQRWGQLEQDVMAGINATFQTIDSMWVNHKEKFTSITGN